PVYLKQMEDLVTRAARLHFNGDTEFSEKLSGPFQRPLGIFVTAKKAGKILGCMGNLHPQEENLAAEVITNLSKAFGQDPRHLPIEAHQVGGLEIFITWVGRPRAISRPETLNPFRDSIMVSQGRRRAIVLAGEAKTLRYQLALARAKAGIRTDQPYQIYRLTSKSLSVKIPEDFSPNPHE
ncbi:MAG: AMMECR1 domain-containing protein, partial [bacterium]|nr:AMMECR1 domain-containing protein [bacterium]